MSVVFQPKMVELMLVENVAATSLKSTSLGRWV